MASRERLAAVAALVFWLGCGEQAGEPAGPSAPAAPSAAPSAAPGPTFALAALAEAAPAPGPVRAWSAPVEAAPDEPYAVTLPLPPGRAALRLSASPPLEDDALCFRLEQLTVGGADWLGAGPDCLGCGLSLLARPTEGFWALPGAGAQATARFSLRDCLSGDARPVSWLAAQGRALRWQALASAPLAPEATLEVRIGFTEGVAGRGGADGGVALWGEVLSGVRAYFAAAGVRVVVSRLEALPATERERVTSRSGDERELAALAAGAAGVLGAGAGEVYLPVVVVPCLEREDLLSGKDIALSGFTPRLPGGAREAGRAEAVFLAGACAPGDEPPEAARLARVMAHEMGHYLGLRHSDAPAGEALAEPGQVDLMDSSVVYRQEALAWSPRQREALRLHPLLR